MPKIEPIPLRSLRFDLINPRLARRQTTDDGALEAMTQVQQRKLVALAGDIVREGVDPTVLTMVVRETDGTYTALDGNRRLSALRALEDPERVSSVLDDRAMATLRPLAARYKERPIAQIMCCVFESRDEADHWIRLRHTGENRGAGQIRWGSDEQDRYEASRGETTPALSLQVLDLLQKHDLIDAGFRATVPTTTLLRMLQTKEIRAALGVTRKNGRIELLEAEEIVLPRLLKVVRDIGAGGLWIVGDLYYVPQRRDYAIRFSDNRPPPRLEKPAPDETSEPPTDARGDSTTPAERSGGNEEHVVAATERTGGNTSSEPEPDVPPAARVATDALAAPGPANPQAAAADTSDAAAPQPSVPGRITAPVDSMPVRLPRARLTLIRPECPPIWIGKEARLGSIERELRDLRADQFRNAAAVLLRVFVELSVDAYMSRVPGVAAKESDSLFIKLEAVTRHLIGRGVLSTKAAEPVLRAAQREDPFILPHTVEMNGWVHNFHVNPLTQDLLAYWENFEEWFVAVATR